MDKTIKDICINDNYYHVWYNEVDDELTKKTLLDMLEYLKSLGFEIYQDDEFKICNWYKGKNDNLSFVAHSCGRTVEINIWDNENHHWVSDMEYLNQRRCKILVEKVRKFFIDYLKDCEIENNAIRDVREDTKKLTSEERILKFLREKRFDKKWQSIKSLSELDGQTAEGIYDRVDRDKKTIYNGQVKYYRDRYGRLAKGIVYFDGGNMYWVISNDKQCSKEANFQFFDLTEDDLKVRRLKSKYLPVKYFDKYPKDSPENIVRQIFNSKIKPKQLGKIFCDYMENRCIDIYNPKLKNPQDESYYAEGKCWNWNKVACRHLIKDKYQIEIVFRLDAYFLIYYKGERIIELDPEKVFNYQPDKLKECFSKYSNLFKIIKGD